VASVVLEQLTKVYEGPEGRRAVALESLNLAVEEKELLVLVGPSGCGKTTTLRLIAGFEAPTSGTISISGRVVNQVPPKEREVAMVFQNPALYPHLSAFENMAFGLKLRRCPKLEIERRVKEMAELLAVSECLERRPNKLSGGQRQRVALGRALVRRPKVLLMDEPLSNLDAPMRAQMRAEIARIHASLGATILYVTHDQAEAMALGQRIAVLKQGTLQQMGSPMEVYRQPANMFVAGFIGSPGINFFRGRLVEVAGKACFQTTTNRGDTPGLILPLDQSMTRRLHGYAGRDLVMGIRPENIQGRSGSNLAGCSTEALVEASEPMGADTILRLKACPDSFVARVPADNNAEAGARIRVSFDMTHAKFFDPTSGQAIV